jgi:hypothetical protein
MSREA